MDKRFERHHLDQLFAALPDLPRGQIEEGEKPDFVILVSGVRIGIEHTTLFHHGPRVRAREAAEEVMAKVAQREAELKGCPPLLVFVEFSHDTSLPKGRIDDLGRQVAGTVLGRLPAVRGSVTIPEELSAAPALPSEIRRIQIARPVDLRRGNWQPSRVGIVPYDFRDTLQRELDEKRAKLPIYLNRCDQCWLLVVATGDVPSSFVDLEGGTPSVHFDFAFERTFFLDAFRGQAFELRRRPGAV